LISFSSSGRLVNTATVQNNAITTMVVTRWAT